MAADNLARMFEENTINEPVSTTVMRDVRLVGRRLLLVVLPSFSSSDMKAELRDWDLWGPLFICMSLAVMLSIKAHQEASLVFSVIFVIVWVGAAVITVNGQLLGGKLSFFQSVCLLGYCVFPVLLAAIASWTFNEFINSDLSIVLRFATVIVALLWSIWASSSFMTDAKFPEGRKLLALYPVLLFYLSLAWMVLIAFQRNPVKHTAAVAQAQSQTQAPLLTTANGTASNLTSISNRTTPTHMSSSTAPPAVRLHL